MTESPGAMRLYANQRSSESTGTIWKRRNHPYIKFNVTTRYSMSKHEIELGFVDFTLTLPGPLGTKSLRTILICASLLYLVLFMLFVWVPVFSFLSYC